MPSPRIAAYDGYAAAFEAAAAGNAFNAYYDRPAVLALLGDVAGQQILDAGCGPGLYASELLARGAEVEAFDQSGDMVRLTASRLSSKLSVRQHDLDDPLDWLVDESFDQAIMTLVIHYVRDRVSALREIHRVLRPGGRLVVSTSHPTADWLVNGSSYFEEGYVEDQWSCGLLSRFWRQPLEKWFAEFVAAGFSINQLVELRPSGDMAERHPEEYAKLSNEPGFIAFGLHKKLA